MTFELNTRPWGENVPLYCKEKSNSHTYHSGLTRGHDKNDKIQKKNYFHQIQSILTLWQKIDFLFFIYL